jgi:hypothetical protein
MMSEGDDAIQCENFATQKSSTNKYILLEPQIKVQRLSDKDIGNLKHRRVLNSIENFEQKRKFHNLYYVSHKF